MIKKGLIVAVMALSGFMMARSLDKMNAQYDGDSAVPVKVSKVFYEPETFTMRLMLLKNNGERLEKTCGASPSSAQLFQNIEGQDVILHVKEMQGILSKYHVLEHIQSNTYLPTC